MVEGEAVGESQLDRWDLACPDWRERLASGLSLVPDLPLDRQQADLAVSYFDDLQLPDVPGNPLLRDAAGEWFRDILRAVFGSLDPETGRRFVRDVFCLVPKKNSKTTYSAGLMLVALLMNERPQAQFAFLGPSQEVADTAFSAAAGMVRRDEGLSRFLKVRDHVKEIEHLESGAILKVMTFDPAVVSGKKFAGVLIDEIHELGAKAKAASTLSEIRGAKNGIPEQFVVIITTQSSSPPAGIFRSELMTARKVRDGTSSVRRYLPILYEFPEEIQRGDDAPWNNPSLWPQVQPNLGRPATIADLREERDTALEKGPTEFREWAAKHLNVEIGLALHSNRWVGADYWLKQGRPFTYEELLENSEVIVFGADGGGLDDLFGFCALGRDRLTKVWRAWSKAYCDREVLDRRKDVAPRLLDFERDGDLTFIDLASASNDDVAEMVAMIEMARDADLLPEKNAIGLDRSGVAVGLLIDALIEVGFAPETMRAVGQGYRLQSAHGMAARRLKQGTLVHAAQPFMAWCVGNARAVTQGHATVITKETSGSAKIDPLIALFNAVDLMSYNPQPFVKPQLGGFLRAPIMVV